MNKILKYSRTDIQKKIFTRFLPKIFSLLTCWSSWCSRGTCWPSGPRTASARSRCRWSGCCLWRRLIGYRTRSFGMGSSSLAAGFCCPTDPCEPEVTKINAWIKLNSFMDKHFTNVSDISLLLINSLCSPQRTSDSPRLLRDRHSPWCAGAACSSVASFFLRPSSGWSRSDWQQQSPGINMFFVKGKSEIVCDPYLSPTVVT